MAFELKKAGAPDLEELGAVLGKAYEHDPILTQLMPGVDQATQDAFWTAWLREDMKKPGEMIFKVVDVPTGKAVAFTKVRYPAKPAERTQEHDAPPEGTNVPLLMHWFEQMDTYRDKHMNYEKDFFVNVLCTLPEYHRKGLGSMLLQRFLDNANKANAKTYIQATEMGAGLYPRFGWRDVEEMTVRTPKGDFVWRCMMREPNSERYRQ
ncbi:hypothetical protein BDZ45DRAFT_674390 [Acephala macrosclerotiorum]|nr:hypothetical protein BDZ45DRAFT_674390 [Acephala macrosclerotiorum]